MGELQAERDRRRAEEERERRDRFLLVRASCGMAGLLLLFSLSLVWLDPPSSTGEDEYYTGWLMLAAGLGMSDQAPHLCGEDACPAVESFVVGAMPTLAVGGAAAFLLLTMWWPNRVIRGVAIGSCVLSLLGLLGLWQTMVAAASNTPSPDQNNLRAGLWAVLVGLIVGLWAAVATGRRNPSRQGWGAGWLVPDR